MHCAKCLDDKDPIEMKSSHGKPINICRCCDNKARKIRGHKPKKYSQFSDEQKFKIASRVRKYRTDPSKYYMFIYTESRRNDFKKGRSNDLTKEFIRNLIGNPCQYCGEDKTRITLDRIDNLIGHMQANVVPCCMRCNYIRRVSI